MEHAGALGDVDGVIVPFHKLLVRLVERIIPGGAEEQALSILDERFLSSPSLAAPVALRA